MSQSNELAKQEPKSMRVGSGGVLPQTMDDVWRLSNAIAKSNTAPKGMTAEDIFIAVNYGMAVGLPWVVAPTAIAVINGKPSLWGRYLLGVVQASGNLEDVQESYEGKPGTDDFAAVCRVKRKGLETWAERRFTVAMAKKAGLWGKSGPWANHPEKMLMWRARGGAFGETFADSLCGLAIAEELVGDDPIPVRNEALERTVVESENVDAPTPLPNSGEVSKEQASAWESEIEGAASKPIDPGDIDALTENDPLFRSKP